MSGIVIVLPGRSSLTFITFADVKNKWEKSSWGRKLIVPKRRAALNDFDRFQIMLAKIKVSFHLCFAAMSAPFTLHVCTRQI